VVSLMVSLMASAGATPSAGAGAGGADGRQQLLLPHRATAAGTASCHLQVAACGWDAGDQSSALLVAAVGLLHNQQAPWHTMPWHGVVCSAAVVE
jgi:hypothetical protein